MTRDFWRGFWLGFASAVVGGLLAGLLPACSTVHPSRDKANVYLVVQTEYYDGNLNKVVAHGYLCIYEGHRVSGSRYNYAAIHADSLCGHITKWHSKDTLWVDSVKATIYKDTN